MAKAQRASIAVNDDFEVPRIISTKRVRYENLKSIEPLTETQDVVFRLFNKDKNLMMHGMAGTGKTFLAVYLAMKQVLLRDSPYKKVVVVRSCVPVRDIGFTPGSKEEKEMLYELPYRAIFNEIFIQPKGEDLMMKLREQGLYEFFSTSYIRGVTLHDSIVIVDEWTSLTSHELDSIITRLGNNCKIVFCGDHSQSDLKGTADKRGALDFMRVIDRMTSFEHIEFDEDDVVRSSLVKEYLIKKKEAGFVA